MKKEQIQSEDEEEEKKFDLNKGEEKKMGICFW